MLALRTHKLFAAALLPAFLLACCCHESNFSFDTIVHYVLRLFQIFKLRLKHLYILVFALFTN